MAAASNTIDAWLLLISKGCANVDPTTIPLGAIWTLVKQSVYSFVWTVTLISIFLLPQIVAIELLMLMMSA